VKALNGTGVWTTLLLVVLPDEPPPDAPLFVLLPVADEREVPASDVVALEEMLLDVLALDRTVELLEAADDGESADVVLTLEVADVVGTLLEARADVEAAEVETPTVEDAAKSALPGDAVTPDPAPDEEPAVFDTGVEDELPDNDDWIYMSCSFWGLSWNFGSVSKIT
jgi:hypothetical protein